MARGMPKDQSTPEQKLFEEVWSDIGRLQNEAASIELQENQKGERDDTLALFKLKQIATQRDLLELKRKLLADRSGPNGVAPAEPRGIVDLGEEREPE